MIFPYLWAVFNWTAMKKTLIAIVMAGAMSANLTAQEIGKHELEDILESFAGTADGIARMNAISGNRDLRKLAVDREHQGKTDHFFRYRVNVSGITDQQQSGRCWMFTSMNVLRPSVMEKFGIEEFDFSHNFCYFWDLFEKSNLFLENAIATADRPMTDRDVEFFFKTPVGDGGVWNLFYNVAEKYGVVPQEVMPETAHSNNTTQLRAVLNERLRAGGYALREQVAAGAGRQEVAAAKVAILKEVYRILALCLGEPPTEFTWRYETCDGEVKTLRSTPLDFYRISSRFTNSRYHPVLKRYRAHHGVDYAAPAGTPVYAIGSGKVIAKAYQAGGGGNYVKIRHNSTYTTTYMHLSRFARGLKVGATVKQKEVIGYVGSTGLSTGPHLDFRVYENGRPVNPLTIKSQPKKPISEANRTAFRHVCDSLVQRLRGI